MMMEPIQDDIEMIRLCLTADDLAPPPYPGALAALDRLVAERDRLLQERAALQEANAGWDVTAAELVAERDRDYADMRKFQAKFIEADQERDRLQHALIRVQNVGDLAAVRVADEALTKTEDQGQSSSIGSAK
jgi:hypothetical protein